MNRRDRRRICNSRAAHRDEANKFRKWVESGNIAQESVRSKQTNHQRQCTIENVRVAANGEDMRDDNAN
jgi:hypothetical protein